MGNVITQANAKLQAEHFRGGGSKSYSIAMHCSCGVHSSYGYLSNVVGNVPLGATPALITRQRQNIGRTRVIGCELQSRFEPRHDLFFGFSYLFTAASVVDFAADASLIGKQSPQVPPNSFTVQATYVNARLLRLSLQGRAVGTEYDDDRNLLALDNYFNLGIYVSRDGLQNVTIFVAAENVLNEALCNRQNSR